MHTLASCSCCTAHQEHVSVTSSSNSFVFLHLESLTVCHQSALSASTETFHLIFFCSFCFHFSLTFVTSHKLHFLHLCL